MKGISRQVIVLHPQNEKLFEQAIFILKDNAVGKDAITDERLMKEAERLLNSPRPRRRKETAVSGPLWAGGGALVTGLLWLLTSVI